MDKNMYSSITCFSCAAFAVNLISYPFLFLPACLPVCLSACLPVCLSACLPVCLSACLPVCLSVCLPVFLPSCLQSCSQR